MPTYEVAPVSHAGETDHKALHLRRLADQELDAATLASDLRSFVDSYGVWIDDLGRIRRNWSPATVSL